MLSVAQCIAVIWPPCGLNGEDKVIWSIWERTKEGGFLVVLDLDLDLE